MVTNNNINDKNNYIIPYNNGNDSIGLRDVLVTLERGALDNGIEEGLQGLTDIKICSSVLFNQILMSYIYVNLFKPLNVLKKNNRYIKDILYIVMNIYIFLCNRFDKCITISGYYNLIGTDKDYLYRQKQDDGLNPLRNDIENSLLNADNERQKMRASDSKAPILNLAYNNYVHGWNGQIKSNEIKATAKTLQDISADLSVIGEQIRQATIEQQT